MKTLSALFSVALLLLCAALPVSAAAFDLMPTADNGYTIVAGDGTVSLDNGTMVITNNGDGDLRVTVDTKTAFDLSALPLLHMQFDAEMPFKMAYHVVCESDSTSAWPNTSTNFPNLFEVDTAADRAAAGEYDVKMDIASQCTSLTDTSSVYFDQFIILVTGKGTFTLNTVEMTDGEADSGDGDTAATTEATVTTTTVKKAENTEENPYTGDVSDTAALIVAAMGLTAILGALIVKKQRA